MRVMDRISQFQLQPEGITPCLREIDNDAFSGS